MKSYGEQNASYDMDNYLETEYQNEIDSQAIMEEYKNGNIFGKQVPF